MTRNSALARQNILITRPLGQGESLGQAITDVGGTPVYFPLLQILPVKDEHSLGRIKQQIQNLDGYDLAIFISTNAATHGLQWIDRYWPQFPQGVKVFAVGPATAAALGSLQVAIHSSPTGMQSEDLLQLQQLRDVSGLKIALFRGVGGRELLANTLRDRGAVVDYIEVYQRSPPEAGSDELIQTLKSHGISAIVVTSVEILVTLCHLARDEMERIQSLPVIVPSERIREKAIEAGFTQVVTSGGANDDAILAALLSRLAGQ